MSATTGRYAGDNLDRTQTSGPLSDEEADKSKATHRSTERNPNRRTGFNPFDENINHNPSVRRHGKWYVKWDWFNRLDSGIYANDRRRNNQIYAQESDIKLFCGRLHCSDYQQQRVQHLFKRIDGDSYSGNYRSETVILALISLVQQEDILFDRVNSEQVGVDVRDRDEWEELLDKIEISKAAIRDRRNKYHSLL
jgi:hypothetical protein